MVRQDKIISFDEQEHHINSIDTDYKAEVVATGFIEQGYDAERTLIMRSGASRRGFTKDIEYINVEFSQQDLFDYLYIYTNRASIYDSLPESLFHKSVQTERKRSKDDVIREIQKHRTEEFYARRFFKPLEVAIDNTRTAVQMREQLIDKKNVHRNFVEIFELYWPVIKLLPLGQAVFFMKMIPIIQNINNDFKKISRVMCGILGYNVSVGQNLLTIIKNKHDNAIPNLGDCELGRNLVVGNLFKNGYRNIQITIGPLTQNDVDYFVEGADGDIILKTLIDMIIPCDREIVIKLDVKAEDSGFVVSNDRDLMPYLGITTYV